MSLIKSTVVLSSGEKEKKLEELYLKVFKLFVLGVMSLCLIGIVLSIPYVAYNLLQTPNEPMPAKVAPQKEITLDDLKLFLIEEKKRELLKEQNKGEEQSKSISSVEPSAILRFQEQATAIFRCANEFARLADQSIANIGDEESNKQLKVFRLNIEQLANNRLRGEAWVAAVKDFGCLALKDAGLASLKKEGQVGGVVFPMINFHARMWDRVRTEKINYDQGEINRVAKERNAENNRVADAKAKAVAVATADAFAFGGFMLLAIYLLLAKVENNIRDISRVFVASKDVTLEMNAPNSAS